MVDCAREKGIDFCVGCNEYPCEDLRKFKEQRPHRIELWESQERIRDVGYAQWFSEMRAHFACPACGTINSAYDLQCRKCGEDPSCGYVERHRDAILAYLSDKK